MVPKNCERNKLLVPLGESENLIIKYYEKRTGKKLNITHKDIVTGDPRKIILEKANDWKPTYIVIGARGSGSIKDMSLGSVAQYITEKAKTSVIVVRPNNDEDTPIEDD